MYEVKQLHCLNDSQRGFIVSTDLNEFDRFMEDYKKGFDKGTGRKRNNEYSRKQSYRQRCKAKIRKEWDGYYGSL